MVRFKQSYWAGIIVGIIIILLDLAFMYGTRWFLPLILVGITVGWVQFWTDYFFESQARKDYESRFLDLVRNLVGAVKSGMPISKAIIHVSSTSDYGSLNRHVKKLSNQVEWAIPIKKALTNFANATGSDIIKRAISTVIEAEQSGGNVEDVLESITMSLLEIKKIKDSRRASIHGQILQSYIIFFVFLVVMVVIQSLLVPYLSNMQTTSISGDGGFGNPATMSIKTSTTIDFSTPATFILTMLEWFITLQGVFLMLALIQGFFAGLVIGKLSEGELMSGFRHSLILMTVAFLIMTVIQ